MPRIQFVDSRLRYEQRLFGCEPCVLLAFDLQLRHTTAATRDIGTDSQITAPAAVPTAPVKDHRFTLALAVADSMICVALLAVMAFRHLVSRQLREIDAMADTVDLDDLPTDCPAAS